MSKYDKNNYEEEFYDEFSELYEEDFDTDFESDEDAEEALDAFIEATAELLEENEGVPYIIIPERIKLVMGTYHVLKYMLRGTGAKVTYGLNKPSVRMGFVTVEGRDIEFKHPEWLLKILNVTNVFDVYPKTNGNILIDFTFNNIAKRIDEEGM